MTTSDRRTYNARLREAAKVQGVKRVSATVSEDEYRELEASAKAAHERVTTHLKHCAFAHLRTEYIVPADIEAKLDELIAIMRGIGNNLNQLARHSNEMKYFLDTGEVKLQLRRMEDEVRTFVASPPQAGKTP